MHADANVSMTERHRLLAISVVIPVYRSSQSLPILVERLDATLRGLNRSFEIVLVDDASPDDTWNTLNRIKKNYEGIKIVRLLRNSGQHNALLCGFTLVTGGIVVTMDDDLQNPPEEIPKLVAAVDEGFDLAIGAYASKFQSGYRGIGGRLVDAAQRRIFGLPEDFQLTSFRAIRRVVVENVVSMAGGFPYVTSMLLSHTAKYVNVPVRHEARTFGRSTYDLRRSLLLAMNLFFNYSSYPLYVVAGLCACAFTISSALGIGVLWTAVTQGSAVPGWASIMLVSAFFNTLTMLSLIILGMYLSRLNQLMTRTRATYIIGEIHE